MRKRKFHWVYQFKIRLNGISPSVWRRIQVPEYYTFWDLHVAIQDAMGWLDYHLHEFYMTHPVTSEKVIIGVPDEEDELFERETLPDDREKISDWFSMENRKADYTYDFGDNWTHSIVLKDILPRDRDRDYPLCIAGKRACPPRIVEEQVDTSNFSKP